MNKNEIRPPDFQRHARPGIAWLLVVITVIIGAAAVVHTLTRNKIHAIGRQQSVVEGEIAGFEDEVRTLEMKIEESLSRKNLTERLAARRTKLRDISPDSIVRISSTQNEAAAP